MKFKYTLEFNSKDIAKVNSRGEPIIYLPVSVKVIIDEHIEPDTQYVIDYTVLNDRLGSVKVNNKLVYHIENPAMVAKYKANYARLSKLKASGTTKAKAKPKKKAANKAKVIEIDNWQPHIKK